MPDERCQQDFTGSSYTFRRWLIGAACRFELTDHGLTRRVGGRSANWPYHAIASIRLSYRPVWMQSRRFRADIENVDGERIAVLSTSWQTAALMAPQDRDYRAFILQLHRRLALAGNRPVLSGGISPKLYAAALVSLALAAAAMAGLLARAIATGELAGLLFLASFTALFTWKIGGVIRRNRPCSYALDDLPQRLLP